MSDNIDEYEYYMCLAQEEEMLKNLAILIYKNGEDFTKEVCRFASGRLYRNEYTEMYKNILKKDKWSKKQFRVILLHLINNLNFYELNVCYEKSLKTKAYKEA